MSSEISERAFEEAIECALLRHGPDACQDDVTAVRESPPPYVIAIGANGVARLSDALTRTI